MAEFSKLPTSWKIILGTMTGNVIISEADTLMQVKIKAENHMPYRELVDTSECKEL
jgi:hypothetical protein